MGVHDQETHTPQRSIYYNWSSTWRVRFSNGLAFLSNSFCKSHPLCAFFLREGVKKKYVKVFNGPLGKAYGKFSTQSLPYWVCADKCRRTTCGTAEYCRTPDLSKSLNPTILPTFMCSILGKILHLNCFVNLSDTR